jgi:tRNA(fMet)-specific endonuclease VapC
VYVLDTDILSIHQSENGEEYQRVRTRLDSVDPTTVFVSIVSLHEQAIGWNAYLQRAKKMEGLIHGYGKFERMLVDFTRLNILGFDQGAADEYDPLKSLGIRIGAMDLRIAAIALANDCTVVTRNTVDFERVPGLRFEDWTLPMKQ